MRAPSAKVIAVFLLSVFPVACPSGPRCGPGTREENGQCAPSLRCGPGTREENGQCVVAASPATASPSSSSAAGASATAEPLTGPERVKRDVRVLLDHAGDGFARVRGKSTYKHPAGDEAFELQLALSGCADLDLWRRSTGLLEVRCVLVPNRKDSTLEKVGDEVDARTTVIAEALPADWHVERRPGAGPYSSRFEATSPDGRMKMASHVVPREDETFDAVFAFSVTPPPKK